MPPGVLERTSFTTMRLTIEDDEQALPADQFAPFCARAIIDGSVKCAWGKRKQENDEEESE